jgi:hypothetical protein
MAVPHKASVCQQTWQAPVKLAISTPGWQLKFPHHVQTDESQVFAPSRQPDPEEQGSFAVSPQKSLISSNIFPILDAFQNPQFHFATRGIDSKLVSSYFHFRFRCNANNDSMTEIFCPSRSEMNHGVHDCFSLTIRRAIPIFQYKIYRCGASLLREAVEETIFSNFTGSDLRRASLFLSFESVKEILEVGGGSRVVIPSSIEVISRSYVESLGLFESIILEKDSKVQRIEESAFAWPRLKSIVIPPSVQILCKSCFAHCNSLESIMFKNGSRLQRIEESAFVWSGLKWIVIPSSVEIVYKLCFAHCKSLESVVFENGSRLQRIEKSAFFWSGLKSIIIPSSVEILSTSCFAYCTSFESVIFDNDSRLQRIEESAFHLSGLKSIIIPSSVEILCEFCFASCNSLESVIFENDSKLIRIEESAFLDSSGFLLISEQVLDGFRRRAHCQLAIIVPSEKKE